MHTRAQSSLIRRLEHTRQGFTLIEAISVVCILALVATGTMLTLSAALKRATIQATVVELLLLDRWSRDHSRHAQVWLEFDMDQQRVTSTTESGEKKELIMSKGSRILRVISRANMIESGKTRLHFQSGSSSTYGFVLATFPSKDTWHIFSGPTGQHYSVERNEQVDAQLRDWFTRWSDAR